MYDNDGNMTDAVMLQVVSEEKRKCQLLLEGTLAENERLKAAMREIYGLIYTEIDEWDAVERVLPTIDKICRGVLL